MKFQGETISSGYFTLQIVDQSHLYDTSKRGKHAFFPNFQPSKSGLRPILSHHKTWLCSVGSWHLMARFEPGKIIRTLDETRLARLLECLLAYLLACLLTCLQTFIHSYKLLWNGYIKYHKVRNTCIRAYIHLHIHTSTHSCTHLPMHPSVHTYTQIVSCHSCLGPSSCNML